MACSIPGKESHQYSSTIQKVLQISQYDIRSLNAGQFIKKWYLLPHLEISSISFSVCVEGHNGECHYSVRAQMHFPSGEVSLFLLIDVKKQHCSLMSFAVVSLSLLVTLITTNERRSKGSRLTPIFRQFLRKTLQVRFCKESLFFPIQKYTGVFNPARLQFGFVVC